MTCKIISADDSKFYSLSHLYVLFDPQYNYCVNVLKQVFENENVNIHFRSFLCVDGINHI